MSLINVWKGINIIYSELNDVFFMFEPTVERQSRTLNSMNKKKTRCLLFKIYRQITTVWSRETQTRGQTKTHHFLKKITVVSQVIACHLNRILLD